MTLKNDKLNAKVKGGSLFHALFAIFIVGALLATMMSMTFFQKKVAVRQGQKHRLLENLKSIGELALSDFPISKEGEFIDLYGEGQDSAFLKTRTWGLFEQVSARAICKGNVASRTFFIGQSITADKRPAIYLADRNQALRVTGNTRIEGKAFVPAKGVERGYIQNSNYSGDKLIYGATATSGKSVPEINKDLLIGNFNYLNGILEPEDSLAGLPLPGDTLDHEFNRRTMVVEQDGWVFLDDVEITGNIIIRSSQAVTIRNTASISDAIIYAPYIEIETGFEGNLQCFARDSMKVGEMVQLNYPSALALIDDFKQNEVRELEIGAGSVIEGQVLVYDEFSDFRKLPVLSLAQETLVEGECYSNGFTELKGTVHGSIYTQKFLLRTPGSTYENYLMDATIQPAQLSAHFLGGPLLTDGDYHKSVLKWVE